MLLMFELVTSCTPICTLKLVGYIICSKTNDLATLYCSDHRYHIRNPHRVCEGFLLPVVYVHISTSLSAVLDQKTKPFLENFSFR